MNMVDFMAFHENEALKDAEVSRTAPAGARKAVWPPSVSSTVDFYAFRYRTDRLDLPGLMLATGPSRKLTQRDLVRMGAKTH
jgi:hypothetical protein